MFVITFFLDSIAYEKTCSSLTNKNLVKGIKQASPIEQTSCLEGFHSVLNKLSPKMIGCTYRGMFFRYVLYRYCNDVGVWHTLCILHRGSPVSSERRGCTKPW
jgi:hypothetical protein